jgi:hypothetical protein
MLMITPPAGNCASICRTASRAQRKTPRIHTHHALPFLQARLQYSANVADAGIVDQDIEPALSSSDLLYRGSDLRLLSHIELLRTRIPSGSLNFSGNPLRRILSDVCKNDVRALLRKDPRDVLTDTRSSSRYKGDFLI